MTKRSRVDRTKVVWLGAACFGAFAAPSLVEDPRGDGSCDILPPILSDAGDLVEASGLSDAARETSGRQMRDASDVSIPEPLPLPSSFSQR
jgi:hypothetical protein